MAKKDDPHILPGIPSIIRRPRVLRVSAKISKPGKIRALPVRDVMTKGVIVLESNKTILDAAKIMSKNNIGSVVIMEKGKAIGIVTERDLVRKVVAKKRLVTGKVKSIMSSPIRTTTGDQPITDTVLMMKKYKIKRLPVVDKKKRLIGMLTDTDVARALPGMLDLVLELSNIERFDSETYQVGMCNVCANYSDTLDYRQGELICRDCREDEDTRLNR